jgi:hypothetical protein
VLCLEQAWARLRGLSVDPVIYVDDGIAAFRVWALRLGKRS